MIEESTFDIALSKFLKCGWKNAWLNLEKGKIYLRKSYRIGSLFLDIANVNVYETGRGTFKSWLKIAEAQAASVGLTGIYVENVMDDQFASFFRKAGWIKDSLSLAGAPPLDIAPSFWKRFEATNVKETHP